MNHFLTNETETTFLSYIKQELQTCTSFSFSVSFIKKAGLVLLMKDIEEALQRGCIGNIITSTYQNFTDIESLRIFLRLMKQYPNFLCHLENHSFVDQSFSTRGYHSKGYLFSFVQEEEVIVGSSNITRYALLKNIEWDVVVKEEKPSALYVQAQREFNDKWNKTPLLTDALIKEYGLSLNYAIERWDMDFDVVAQKVKPNYMQTKALKELMRYRSLGVNKTLIIAAAGSGKTYLAAFDAWNFDAKRLLYIVHESSILEKALDTFKQVFHDEVTYGLFTGSRKELDADFIFATNISMSQSLSIFDPEEFDYIVIDECHHATALTYQKIISYFKPEFLLGLTATPERMDNQDVFSLFEENVPFELRLRDAIINELVVPFHYYGIRDTLVDYDLKPKQEHQMIAQLVDENHCEFIIQEIEKHRFPNRKLKALAFCRSIRHAEMMAKQLSSTYHTAYLTGKNTTAERLLAYEQLQDDSQKLEILFTVDILNEGVDIPGVNMILFLRPTESSTIFIQQLGRGLRKYQEKKYVTVLDFIGNSYQRSTQIAFALSSLSENFVIEKKLLASLIKDDFEPIGLKEYGVEIHLDEESKEEILANIEKENFNNKKYLVQDYKNFKKYMHCEYSPSHMDYLNNDCAPNLLKFMAVSMKGKKNHSYYQFLKKIGEEHLPLFSEQQEIVINALSDFLPLVRPNEYQILKEVMHSQTIQQSSKDDMYALKELIKKKCITEEYQMNCDSDDAFVEYVDDLLEYGLQRYAQEFAGIDGFKLYYNYRKEQVLLKMYIDTGYNLMGTYYVEDKVIIFAALKKDLDEENRLNYKDYFKAPNIFQWESKTNLSSKELTKLRNASETYLFIRKMESEDGLQLPFTYVGKGKSKELGPTNKNGTYLFDVQLEQALPEDLQFDFGIRKEEEND